MEKIVKEFYVYDFNELKEDVKKELIEKERDSQRENYCDFYLEEDMKEESKDLLQKYFGITSEYLQVYYDLSYSQGSGAMIEFDINIEDLNNKYKIFSEEEIRFINDCEIVNNIKVRHNDNYYYHEYTFGIDSDYYSIGYDYEDIKEDYNISEEDFNTIEERLDNLLIDSDKHYTKSEFVKDIISMNKELVGRGYDNIEYFWNCEDSEIIEFLEEHKYLESGEVYE